MPTPESPQRPDANTGRHFVRGLAWVGSLRWLGQAISWVSTLAVMRLLVPADYGLVGMAMVFISIAQMLSDFGIGSTVIAMQKLEASETEELHTASILLGAAALVLAILCAWPLAQFYRQSLVAPVVAVLGLVLLANGAAAVPTARLIKDLDYAGMATADLLRSVVGSLCALALALTGSGLWALVGGQLAGAATAMVFVCRRAPTSMKRPQSGRFREALEYSKETMLGRVAWMFYQGLPSLIGGKLLGAAPLGEYTFAFTLASMPGDKMVNVVTQVAQPVLARHQADSATLRRLLSRIVEGVAFLAWPLLAGMVLVAHPAINVLFGTKWVGAVDPLRLIALYHMAVAVFAPFSYIFLVTGAAKQNRQIAVLGAVVLPGCFWLGAHYWGAAGLAAAWWVAVPLFGLPYFVLLRRLIGFGFPQFLQALKAPALATAGMSVAVLAVLSLQFRSDAECLAWAIAAGATVFTLIAAGTRGRAVWDFASTLRRQAD